MSQPRGQNNLRAEAAKVLHAILEQGVSARECLPEAQQHYNEQDKAWLQEMVYGVLRQLPILQFWLRQLLDKPLKNRYKVAEHLMMLGFYQLAFTRVSTHAAVSETVAAAKRLKAEALKGLINAILRNFIRQEIANKMPDDEQITSGLPKWLFKQLHQAYPADLPDLIKAMQTRPPIWLRVNQQKSAHKDYIDELDRQNIGYNIEQQQSHGLILTKGRDITTLPGFHQGWFSVQDGAAQLAAQYLAPQASDRVLDCCAAPGGKTCHLLELEPLIEECVALDVDPKRLQRVKENLERLELNATLISGDASQPETWWDGQLFDRILLDAPCSATGIIRRHPDIKWLRKSADIDVLVKLQRDILTAIWKLLKPGGTMLYATCSILPQENAEQIKCFLAETADAQLDPLPNQSTPETIGRQILPGEGQMDGFYYARLLKSSHKQ